MINITDKNNNKVKANNICTLKWGLDASKGKESPEN